MNIWDGLANRSDTQPPKKIKKYDDPKSNVQRKSNALNGHIFYTNGGREREREHKQ